jgi:uroporphyrinogen-III decarboxylase
MAHPLVARPTDWRALPEIDALNSSLQREIDALRHIRAQLGPDVPLILPIDSPLTTADLLCNGRIVSDLRSFANDVRSGLALIASETRTFAQLCLDAGADGVLYVKTLAGENVLRAREHRDVEPFDLDILDALAPSAIRILYLSGKRPRLELADRYPVQAVCWETWRADPSIATARRRMRRGVMGGINPATLVDGVVEDVRAQVRSALDQSEGWHMVLAPTGPLPARARNDLIAAMHREIRA